MRGCARKVIYSAWAGYANFGCDIGGYRGTSVKDKNLFVRWAQFGAFLPLMENGGGGEHRPWMYDQETVNIYRTFAQQHHRMAPYLLTSGTHAIATGTSTITPLAKRDESVPSYRSPQPSTYNYLLGPSILVHPVMNELSPPNHTTANVAVVLATFPDIDGKPTEWLDWWHPQDSSKKRSGGDRTVEIVVPFQSYSVFVRRGDMLPLEAASDDDSVVFTWFGPVLGSSATADSTEPVAMGSGITANASIE